jgi:co-chaperonin GroES (HSP10)
MYKDWVAVEEEERKESVVGPGIIVPGRPAGIVGRVLAISEEASKKYGISTGDLVIYERWQGGRWAFGTKKVLIMDASHIIAKITEE